MGIYKLYSCFRGEERLEELGDICCNELGITGMLNIKHQTPVSCVRVKWLALKILELLTEFPSSDAVFVCVLTDSCLQPTGRIFGGRSPTAM